MYECKRDRDSDLVRMIKNLSPKKETNAIK